MTIPWCGRLARLAATSALLLPAGCWLYQAIPEPNDGHLEVSCDGRLCTQLKRGQTVQLRRHMSGDQSDDPLEGRQYDISEAREGPRIGEAPPPRGIVVSGDSFDEEVTLTIGEDARPGLIWVRGAGFDTRGVASQHTEKTYYVYGAVSINVKLGDNAPEVTGPASPFRGRAGGPPIDVEIPVTGVEPGFTLAAATPGITVTDLSYDEVAEMVRAKLHIGEGAPTGHTYLFVESAPVNGESDRSEDIGFTVDGAPPPPTVLGLFPNHARAGDSPRVEFAGSGFTNRSEVLLFGTRLDLVEVNDSHVFPTTLSVPQNPLSAYPYTVRSLGGPSALESFLRIVPSDAPVPDIDFVSPSTIVTNTATQVRIPGVNLDRVVEVVGIGSDQVEAPFFSATILGKHPGFLIVELVGTPGDPALFDGETGAFRLALRDVDGLTTRTHPMQMASRPAAPMPVLKSADRSRILQDEYLEVTLRGERLSDVDDVIVEGSDVSTVGDPVSDPLGYSVTVTLHAARNAPLTGDVATNLVVVTHQGRRSNPISFTVAPGTPRPPECDEIPAVGASYVLTELDGTKRFVGTLSAVPPIDNGFGTQLDVAANGHFVGMTVWTALANFNVNEDPQIQYVSYFDDRGNEWYGGAGTTLRVAEADAHRVALCLEGVRLVARLPGQLPSELTISGHVVFARP